jgi:hypothetical protein
MLLAMEVSKGDRLSLVFCLATVFCYSAAGEFRRLFLALASLAATLPFALTCFKIVALGARASYAPASSFMQLFAKECAWLGVCCLFRPMASGRRTCLLPCYRFSLRSSPSGGRDFASNFA